MPSDPAATIVFDLIGVLAEPSWRELSVDMSLDRWRLLKTGEITDEAFWSAEEAAAYRRVLRLRPDRVALLRELRARGRRIVAASNLASGWADHLAQSPGGSLVDAWVISARVGAAKPDPRFFAALAAAAPVGARFIDDTRANCAAAAAAGFDARWAWPGRDLAALTS
ncbi:MAG: HAD-IA family hydrolase [Myxococcales bacterium]|nr:HAD-IA family hydrolase [Myxococcales bacterium]